MRSEYLRASRSYWTLQEDGNVADLGFSRDHLEEERLRRMLLFADRLQGLTPVFYAVLCALGGDALFAAAYVRFGVELERGIRGRNLVTDTFHPQILARAIGQLLAGRSPQEAERQLYDVFLLELGRWRARSFVNTANDPVPIPELQPGCSVISSSYDLIGVFGQASRLVSGRLPEAIIRAYLGFVGPPSLVAIRPDAEEVLEYAFRFHAPTGKRLSAISRLTQVAPELALEIIKRR